MQLQNSHQLRTKALLGISLFIFFIILSSLYQQHIVKLTAQNHQLLGELELLKESSDSFLLSSRNYQQNAARDFESYNRDIKVFLKDLNADIDSFSKRITSLENKFKAHIGFALPDSLSNVADQDKDMAMLDEAINMAQIDWKTFKKGYEEKLGADEKEPRIEWGTDFIVENHPELEKSINYMTQEYSEFLQNQSLISEKILTASQVGIVIIGLLGLLWFYFRVLKRIGNTVNACIKVANGDFGHTLRIDGNDEIGVLAKAFNLVSSRSQLVMALQNQLHQVQSMEQALTVISQAAGGFLPIAWIGVFHTEEQKNLNMLSALPQQSMQSIPNKVISLEKGWGKALSNNMLTKKSVIQNKLGEYAVNNEQELFIRDLVRSHEIQSVLALPMISRKGWEGYIIFGTRKGEYNKNQTELLENLSTMMAGHFQRLSGYGTES